jgi:hypothetical protein
MRSEAVALQVAECVLDRSPTMTRIIESGDANRLSQLCRKHLSSAGAIVSPYLLGSRQQCRATCPWLGATDGGDCQTLKSGGRNRIRDMHQISLDS